jgi:hypothetical protein
MKDECLYGEGKKRVSVLEYRVMGIVIAFALLMFALPLLWCVTTELLDDYSSWRWKRLMGKYTRECKRRLHEEMRAQAVVKSPEREGAMCCVSESEHAVDVSGGSGKCGEGFIRGEVLR